jgi:predicted MFS family arabinose efflux permease
VADAGPSSRRRDVRLIYLLAVVITTSQGALELVLPLNLHRLHYSLPLVGGGFAALGVGQLVSRLPGGAVYRVERARLLLAGGLAIFGLTTIGLAFVSAWWLQAGLAGAHGFAFGLVTTFMLAALIDVRPAGANVAGTMAWYTAAISTGYAVGAPLGSQALARLGYGEAFWVAGLVGLLAAAGSLGLSLAVTTPTAGEGGARTGSLTRWAALLTLPLGIWLAALLVFYINFISDLMDAFFPIYAVGIGIPIAYVGVLRSVNSLSATGIRFAAGGLFRFFDPHAANHLSVLGMAAGVVALSLVTNRPALLAIFALIGVCRGLIRVTSATAVAEERARPGVHAGLSSGVYNAGLDAGSVLSPPLGGALAAVIGVPATFRVAALALPALYYQLWLPLRSRLAPAAAADVQRLPATGD